MVDVLPIPADAESAEAQTSRKHITIVVMQENTTLANAESVAKLGTYTSTNQINRFDNVKNVKLPIIKGGFSVCLTSNR